jgi:hypothetical protein
VEDSVPRRPLIPKRDRWPKRWTDWLPLGIVVAMVVGVGTLGVWRGGWLVERLNCRDGFPATQIWRQDGECVGITSDDYTFGQPAFAGVMTTIANRNHEVENLCGGGTAATIGVMTTWTALGVGGRALHELEGFAAGQAKANDAGCVHPIRLRVAQVGAGHQAARAIAESFAADPEVVAVVGLGLSDPLAAEAINVLGAAKTPMIADLITAEGFDSRGIARSTHPACSQDYPHGIGNGYLHRVSYRNDKQIAQLAGYLGRVDLVITPTDRSDPYTCTMLPAVQKQFGTPNRPVEEKKFDPADRQTIQSATDKICRRSSGPLNLLYAARARDLAHLIGLLSERIGSDDCSDDITLATLSDGSRVRAAETDPELERLRMGALKSEAFRDERIRLVYPPLADRDFLDDGREFGHLASLFDQDKFDRSHLDDGWGINAYDAMLVIEATMNEISSQETVTRSAVHSHIDVDPVSAVGGSLTFDNEGNRNGNPVVVQLCPPESPTDGTPLRTTTVVVYDSKPKANTCSGG